MTQDLEVLSKYLSEEEMKERAFLVWDRIVAKAVSELHPNDHMRDYERIIGNAAHRFMVEKIGEIIPDFKDRLINNVKITLEKEDSSYYIFKRPDAWDRAESPGWRILQDSVQANKEVIQNKVTDVINEIDFKSMQDEIVGFMYEVIDRKLSQPLAKS